VSAPKSPGSATELRHEARGEHCFLPGYDFYGEGFCVTEYPDAELRVIRTTPSSLSRRALLKEKNREYTAEDGSQTGSDDRSCSGQVEDRVWRASSGVARSMNKNLFLWAAKLPGSGHKNADSWNNSAIEAAEAAMKRKVRVQSNRALGAYEYFFSDNPTPENDPAWPNDLSYDEMLRIAFAKPGRFIDSHNHEVIRLLREG
jgi:hypothetical protein